MTISLTELFCSGRALLPIKTELSILVTKLLPKDVTPAAAPRTELLFPIRFFDKASNPITVL